MAGKIDPDSYGGGSSLEEDEELREALARMAAQDPDPRLRRLRLPPMDLSGPSRPVDLGNPDEPGSEAFRRREERALPMATPATFPDFATWQADPQAREAAQVLSAQGVAEVDAQLADRQRRAAETDALFRSGQEAYAARQAPTPAPPPPVEELGPFASGMRSLGGAIAGKVREYAPGVARFFSEADYVGGEPAPAPATPAAPAPPPPAVRAPTGPPVARRPVRPTRPATPPVDMGMAAPTPSGALARALGPSASVLGPRAEEVVSRTQVAGDSIPTSPPPPSGEGDLDAALFQARQNRLLAGLARAGGMAIGRGGDAAYAALEGQADRPLQELGLRRAEAEQGRAAGARAADEDPSSPQSQAARSMMLEILGPEVGRQPWFPTMSYAVAARGPLGQMLEQSAAIQRERIRARGEVEKERARRARGAGGAREADIQKLGKDVEGLSQVSADLALLERMAATKGDIPGAGRLDAPLAEMGIGDEDIEVRQAAGRVANRLLFEQSGAAVTESEVKRFMAARGLGPGATEEQFRKGVRALAAELRQVLKTKQAKFAPGTRRAYQERGGFTEFQPAPASGGLTPEKQRRLEELRRKRDAGTLR